MFLRDVYSESLLKMHSSRYSKVWFCGVFSEMVGDNQRSQCTTVWGLSLPDSHSQMLSG